ncbi:hypothetical protein ACMXYX_18125 (plasmid) [Neptuniibacter sp. QD72_48]|uniref:hypothetical protein n=1 Tax=Neptuniibacter sp. QD72_48 TaxID=3398214 RepID=UPI0039F5DCF0
MTDTQLSPLEAFAQTDLNIPYSRFHILMMDIFDKSFPDGVPTEQTCKDGHHVQTLLLALHFHLIDVNELTDREFSDVMKVIRVIDQHQNVIAPFIDGGRFPFIKELVQVAQRKFKAGLICESKLPESFQYLNCRYFDEPEIRWKRRLHKTFRGDKEYCFFCDELYVNHCLVIRLDARDVDDQVDINMIVRLNDHDCFGMFCRDQEFHSALVLDLAYIESNDLYYKAVEDKMELTRNMIIPREHLMDFLDEYWFLNNPSNQDFHASLATHIDRFGRGVRNHMIGDHSLLVSGGFMLINNKAERLIEHPNKKLSLRERLKQ